MRVAIVMLLAAVSLGGCATMTGYTLVPSGDVAVAQNSMTVHPSSSWNRLPAGTHTIPQEERWTQNGPVLDSIHFVGALPDGQAIAKQHKDDDRMVPVFHANMTPHDLVSMVESDYRIQRGAKVFDTIDIKPATFLGAHAVQFDYSYMRDDSVKRRGRSMIAVTNGKLYVMSLDGAALHYFDADLPEFEAMAASAAVR